MDFQLMCLVGRIAGQIPGRFAMPDDKQCIGADG